MRFCSYRWLCVAGLPLLLALALWQGLDSAQTVGAGPSSPAMTTFVVTTTNDSGPGSLRQAFIDGDSGFAHFLITFNLAGCPCVITLLSPLLQLSPPVTIQGPGAGLLAVDGGNNFRVFKFNNLATVQDVTIQNGVSSSGAGGGIMAVDDLTLTNVIVRNNTAVVSMSDLGRGGGVNGAKLTAVNTQFIGNLADQGGGLHLSGSAILTNTIFLSNTANYNAGALYFRPGAASTLQIASSEFRHNSAWLGGSAIVASNEFAPLVMTATNTLFVDNMNTGNGGTLAYVGSNLRVVNSLFAHNTPASGAGTLSIYGNAQVLFTTFAHPISGTGSAVNVLSGTVGLTDTIISSYTVGIQQVAPGTVGGNYNLFFANGTNTQGSVITGANSLTGNPKFVNPAAGNYHLSAGSAAIDNGIDAGVYTDIDGQSRPIGAGFDIGFDEYINLSKRLYLPIVLR